MCVLKTGSKTGSNISNKKQEVLFHSKDWNSNSWVYGTL